MSLVSTRPGELLEPDQFSPFGTGDVDIPHSTLPHTVLPESACTGGLPVSVPFYEKSRALCYVLMYVWTLGYKHTDYCNTLWKSYQ